jgi:hypothetical protein
MAKRMARGSIFIRLAFVFCALISFMFGVIVTKLFGQCKAPPSQADRVLTDPEMFAQHLKKHFVCNLPSDTSCGHENDYFRIFERNGVHVLPVHFYSAIPEVNKLKISDFKRPEVSAASLAVCDKDPTSPDCPIPKIPGIDFNLIKQIQTLEACKDFKDELAAIPSRPQTVDGQEIFHSRWACSQHTPAGQACTPFGAIDSQIYHCMIRSSRARRVIEIGSGHSTYIAIEAVKQNIKAGAQASSLTCIEPYPANALRNTAQGIPFELIEQTLQVPPRVRVSLALALLFLSESKSSFSALSSSPD